MRTGTAISVVAHVVALTVWLALAGVRPFEPNDAEAITVDIVTPDQAPPLPKEPDPKYDFPTLTDKDTQQPADKTADSAEPAAQPASPPAPDTTPQSEAVQKQVSLQKPAEPPKPAEQPKPAQQQEPAEQPKPVDQQQVPPPPQNPPPVPAAQPDITSKFGMMFTLPDPGAAGDFDAKSTANANIKAEVIAALRAHLKTCSILPKSVSSSDNVRIVLRVALTPDGRLAREPLLIEASASAKGPLLMHSAMDALDKCQPYAMLPPDRYNEWRLLDLSFVPKDFRG